MAFIGGEELKAFLTRNNIITNKEGVSVFNSKRISQAAYELCLGNEVFRTDNKDKKTEFLDEKNRYIDINPGQFCLLMTEEYINISPDKLAFISIKAKQKLKGLINVSGFHVDPGFKGKLLFSVYNAGPSIITLEAGKAYFLIWFSNLEKELSSEFLYNNDNNHHQGQSSIDPEYLSALKKDELTSPHALLQRIKDAETEFTRKIDDKNRKILDNKYLYSVMIGLICAVLARILFEIDYKSITSYFSDDVKNLESKVNSLTIKNKQLEKDVEELKKKTISLYNNRVEKKN